MVNGFYPLTILANRVIVGADNSGANIAKKYGYKLLTIFTEKFDHNCLTGLLPSRHLPAQSSQQKH